MEPVDLAYFSSDTDGAFYDVAAYLVPDQIRSKPGNRVRLTVLGCCSIVGVTDVKDDTDSL